VLLGTEQDGVLAQEGDCRLHLYNPRRRHSALGRISPDEYEKRCLNRQEKEKVDTIKTTRAA
jgi:hypothetical protein